MAESIYFLGLVIVFDLGPLYNFQVQSMVSMFIQTGSYAKSTVHLKFFLVSQLILVQSKIWSLVLGR